MSLPGLVELRAAVDKLRQHAEADQGDTIGSQCTHALVSRLSNDLSMAELLAKDKSKERDAQLDCAYSRAVPLACLLS